MHFFLTVLVAVTLSVFLHAPAAYGKSHRQKKDKGGGDDKAGSGDSVSCMSDLQKEKQYKDILKNLEQLLNGTETEDETCLILLKDPNYSCQSYAACLGDVMTRAALLVGPLQSVEEDLDLQKEKAAKKFVKKVHKGWKKLLKKAKKTCEKKAAKDEKASCKVTLTKENDKNWKKCKKTLEGKMNSKQLTVILADRLKAALIPSQPAPTELAWGQDWTEGLMTAVKNSLCTLRQELGDATILSDHDAYKDTNCTELFAPPNYCCAGYSECKQDVAQRLDWFNSTFYTLEQFSNLKNLSRVRETVENLMLNVTGQCRKQVKSGRVNCSESTLNYCADTLLQGGVKPPNADGVNEMVALLVHELENFLNNIDLKQNCTLARARTTKEGKCGAKCSGGSEGKEGKERESEDKGKKKKNGGKGKKGKGKKGKSKKQLPQNLFSSKKI